MTTDPPGIIRVIRLDLNSASSRRRYAAKWLGHDPAITLRVYGHVYDDALASAGDALLGRSRATSGGDT